MDKSQNYESEDELNSEINEKAVLENEEPIEKDEEVEKLENIIKDIISKS